MKTLLITLGVAAMLAAVSTPGTAAPLPALGQLAENAKVSALVVRLEDMHTIAAINPDKRLRPASVSKLFTAAAALKTFGPRHRFVTRLTTAGRVANGVVYGNLRLVGSGAPMLDTSDLRDLAYRLTARGITRVTGDLVINAGLFGRVPCRILDRCQAAERTSHSYDAPLSAAGINFGTLHATVYPGQTPDAPTRVVLHPISIYGYSIDNRASTGAPGSHPHLRAWRTTSESGAVLHIRGHLPTGGKPVEIFRSVANPERETALAMNRILANEGVVVEGVARVSYAAPSDTEEAHTLARIKSRPLATQLIPMLAYSNNYMADVLTLDIAVAHGMPEPLTLSEAAEVLEQLGTTVRRKIYGADAAQSHPVFTSGSGLSLENDVSARDLVALLTAMYRNTALFPAFYGSIPVPRYAPHDMLERGNRAFVTHLTAKTGTLTEPVLVRALAGYMRLDDGGFAAYAILINGTQSNPYPDFSDTVGAYIADLEHILATG